MSMKPTQGKRAWVKLWTNEWLDGTTRYQMTDTQRAFWIDLLAMAGRSRLPGIVCAGRDGDKLVGYPLYRFASLMAGPQQIDIEATLTLFEQTGKVKVSVTSEGPPKLFAIELLNWKKYQSDLDAQAERARNYRSRKKVASRERHGEHHASVTHRHAAESESEPESEVEKRNHHPKPDDDDFKKIVLGKCEGPTGDVEIALDIIIERARQSGINITSPKYLEVALGRFNFQEGQDREELMQRQGRSSL